MPFLQPLILRESYVTAIEQETQKLFDELIYAPLLRILNQPLGEIANSISALLDAIRIGKVWYFNGEFHGEYSSKISKEFRMLGAQYSKLTRTWKLEQALIPPPVKFALVAQEGRIRTMRHEMMQALDNVRLDRIDQQNIIDKRYQQILGRIEQDFQKTVSAYDVIAIQPTITQGMRDLISKEWSTNLNLYIKSWTEENIIKLRSEIEPFALTGGRAESLQKVIQQNYEVSRAKAKFLARQETSLLMSKFRESRYSDIGITQYQWRGAMDSRERPDHKALEGKIFRFGQPPVTNLKTGAKNNPGEDYGCFPGNSRINVFNRIEKCFRHWYNGQLTEIVTDSGKTLRATRNHPVLTLAGWKPISSLNEGDYIFKIGSDLRHSIELNSNQKKTGIRKVFESCRKAFLLDRASGALEQFHGDGSAGNIDIIDTTRLLRAANNASNLKCFDEFYFPLTDFFLSCISRLSELLCTFGLWYSLCANVRCFSKFASLFKRKSRHPQDVCFGNGSNMDSIFKQSLSDDDTLNACTFRNGQFALAGKIRFDDGLGIEMESIMGATLDKISRIRHCWYIGHVYNLQTDLGYYTAEDFIVSNCRCVAIPVVN